MYYAKMNYWGSFWYICYTNKCCKCELYSVISVLFSQKSCTIFVGSIVLPTFLVYLAGKNENWKGMRVYKYTLTF